MYFSNPIALSLHACLDKACGIGEIDKGYAKKLGLDACIMEVWDICGGNVEEAYAGRGEKSVLDCYAK